MVWNNYTLLQVGVEKKKGNWTREEDLKVEELFFYLGYTAREIGAELDRSKEAVQKRIQLLTRKGVIDKKQDK